MLVFDMKCLVSHDSPNNTDSGEGAMTPIMLKESREINVSMQWGANKTLMFQQFCNIMKSVLYTLLMLTGLPVSCMIILSI